MLVAETHMLILRCEVWVAAHVQELTGTRESTSVHLCGDAFGGHKVLESPQVPHILS